MPENQQLVVNESSFSQLIDFVLSGWQHISSARKLPHLPGLYVIYAWKDGECLYIGQSQSLYNRGQKHWAWTRAKQRYELPYVIYKVINSKNAETLKSELIYNECLLIGLLRPQWNSLTPPPRSYSQVNNPSSFRVVHWKQLVEDKYDEPFNESMLSEEGFVITKQVQIMTLRSKLQTVWARVVYDKEYANALSVIDKVMK